jgi:hypothetical protein
MMILQIAIHWYLIHLEHALLRNLQLRSWCGIQVVHLPAHPLRFAQVRCNLWMIPGVMYPQ